MLAKTLDIMNVEDVTEVLKAGQKLKYLTKLIQVDHNSGLMS